jgi:hypothetical protein
MRFFKIVALMLVAALLLGACGTATPLTSDEVTESGQRFMIALPRVVVDLDENGNPSIEGLALADIEALTGIPLQSMALNPYYVDWMTNTNVQHLELAHSDDGIFMFVNGEMLPYLNWDNDSIEAVGDVAGMFNVPYARLIGMLAPIIQRTGADVVVRFPVQEGVEAVDLRDHTSPPAPLAAEIADPSLITHIDIDYDETGEPMIAGITSGELAAATGLYLPINLTPDIVAGLTAQGIETVRLVSTGDGLYVFVNGEPLPNVAWDQGLLLDSANLYAQVNPDSPYIQMISMLAPQLDNMDLDLQLRFPGAQ